MKTKDIGNIVGIDLGTTYSAIAYLDNNGTPVTLPNREGETTTASVILLETELDVVVGTQARRAALVEPARVAMDVKRHMGEEFFPRAVLGTKYSPQALSAMILRKLKQDAETQIGPISGAVITVPAYFDETRRQATVQAGQIAGLRVIDILNEPTAAALAYAFRSYTAGGAKPDKSAKPEKPRTVVIYDLGGGTFDVTVLTIAGKQLTVRATAGDVRLGGRDWDERLAAYLAEKFIKEHGSDPRTDAQSRQSLMQQAEDLKRDLSRRQKGMFVVNHAGKVLCGQVERAEFDTLTADLLFRTESRLTRVMRDAGIAWDAIDEVLTVGGSTRMPQVLAMIKRVTGRDANCSLSPDEAVAHGAAIYAAMRVAGDAPTTSTMPPLATTSPAGKSAPAPTEVLEPAHDEAAAGLVRRLAAPVLQLLKTIRATNVSAHSLGVVVEDTAGRKRVSRIIERNTKLPAAAAKCYATLNPNQHRVTVQVVEGESSQPADCMLIGTCTVDDLPKGLPKGSPVEVQFEYDRAGRLGVKAVHVTSGTWAETRIERHKGVNPELVQVSQEMLSRLSIT